jgi:hypothetical protein
MKQKLTKQISYWLGVIAVGIALSLVLQFVRAWTEPSESPPGGNLGAPINSGGSGQTKAGPLGVNSSGLGALPLQQGMDVGGKTQADDFCLRSDPAKCLSSPSGLRVGPPGCNNVLTLSSTCLTKVCDVSCSSGHCFFCGRISLGCAATFRNCDGSCSAGSPVTCPTNPI